MRFSGEPLLIGEPLEVLVEADLVEEGIAVGGGEIVEPEASEFGGLVMGGPPVPAFAVVIFGEERAKEDVVIEPNAFTLAESGEAGGAVGMRDAGGKIGKGEGEEGVFEIFGAGIIDGAFGELFEVVFGFEAVDFCGGEIGNGEGGDFEGRGVEGDGGDGVVGRGIVARGVDGEELDEAEVVFGGPVDEFAEGASVTDAEIVLTAEREKRGKNTGERIFGDGRDQGVRSDGCLKHGKSEKSRLEDEEWEQFECLASGLKGG